MTVPLTHLVIFLSGLIAWGSHAQGLSRLDEGRAQEALHLIDTQRGNIWAGWEGKGIALCIETETEEFLLFHSSPPVQRVEVRPGRPNLSGYSHVGRGLILPTEVFKKNLSLPFPAATAFPLNGQPTLFFPTKATLEVQVLRNLKQTGSRELLDQFTAVNYINDERIYTSSWVIMFVHEHFHAYQSLRAPHKGMVEKKVDYPFDSKANNGLLRQEGKALHRALTESREYRITRAIRSFLETRAKRRKLLNERHPGDLITQYEQAEEWTEGLALYTEVLLSRRANQNHLAADAVMVDQDFKGYANLERRAQNEIDRLNSPALIGPRVSPREIFYSLGMAQALVLDRIKPGWKESVFKDKVYLDDLLREAVEVESE